MSIIKEIARRIIHGKPEEKRFDTPEVKRVVSIYFHDLREKKAAKEKEVDPGYYFTVCPIFPKDLENRMLINKLQPAFFDILKNMGLLGHSDTRIHIDREAKMSIDPEQVWIFFRAGYIDDAQTLFVKAYHVNRDDAQTIIVTSLR